MNMRCFNNETDVITISVKRYRGCRGVVPEASVSFTVGTLLAGCTGGRDELVVIGAQIERLLGLLTFGFGEESDEKA